MFLGEPVAYFHCNNSLVYFKLQTSLKERFIRFNGTLRGIYCLKNWMYVHANPSCTVGVKNYKIIFAISVFRFYYLTRDDEGRVRAAKSTKVAANFIPVSC